MSEAAIDTEAPCARCLSAGGFCRSCLDRSILPQLAQPFWYRLVGTVLVEQKKRQQVQDDPTVAREVERIRRRNARKFSRIARLASGQFAPARPKRAAA